MTGVGAKRIFRRELKRFGDWLNQLHGYGQRRSGTVEEAAEQALYPHRIHRRERRRPRRGLRKRQRLKKPK
jgi:hypothetical protein